MSLTQSTALGLTLALEMPLVMVAAYRWKIAWQRGLLAGLLASGLTHPLAWKASWLVSTLFVTHHYIAWFMAIETGVWLAEAVVFRYILRTPWVKSLGLSLVVNGISAMVGVCLWS